MSDTQDGTEPTPEQVEQYLYDLLEVTRE